MGGLWGTMGLGCADSSTSTETAGLSNDSSSGSTSTGMELSTTDTTGLPVPTSTSPTGVPTTSDDAPVCGNGVLEEGEECDDGNLEVRDACLPTCKNAACGDGIVWTGMEECDDGNGVDDSCTNGCAMGGCGDGIVWIGQEECDDGNQSNDDACTNLCQKIECGDGELQGDEACDDGNTIDEDDCSNECVASRYVFITSLRFNGDLKQHTEQQYYVDVDDAFTGLDRADALCEAVAEHGNLPSRLPWRAWLSDDTGSPSTRFDTSFAGYYRLLDGTPVTKGFAGLAIIPLLNAINVGESGPIPDGAGAAWTNTNPDGTVTDMMNHCENWSQGGQLIVKSFIGMVDSTDETWTNYDEMISCAAGLHLYCFQDVSAP